jgi:hypothetical protein
VPLGPPSDGHVTAHDIHLDQDGLDRLIAAATVKPLAKQDWLQQAVERLQGKAITAAVIRGLWAAMKEARARGEVEGVYKTSDSLETQLRKKGLLVGARRKK